MMNRQRSADLTDPDEYQNEGRTQS